MVKEAFKLLKGIMSNKHKMLAGLHIMLSLMGFHVAKCLIMLEWFW